MIPTDYDYNYDQFENERGEEIDYDTIPVEEENEIDAYNFYPDAAF